MRKWSPITAVLGIALSAYGVFLFVRAGWGSGLIPLVIGAGLTFLAFRQGRVGLIVFGHVLIVTGCALVTLGLYMLPHSQPSWVHVFGRPLFWGLISIFGGICANYHGFCACVRRTAGPQGG